MWAILGAGALFCVTVVLSLAKGSSEREKIAEHHREELLLRKREKPQFLNQEQEGKEVSKEKKPPTSE